MIKSTICINSCIYVNIILVVFSFRLNSITDSRLPVLEDTFRRMLVTRIEEMFAFGRQLYLFWIALGDEIDITIFIKLRVSIMESLIPDVINIANHVTNSELPSLGKDTLSESKLWLMNYRRVLVYRIISEQFFIDVI